MPTIPIIPISNLTENAIDECLKESMSVVVKSKNIDYHIAKEIYALYDEDKKEYEPYSLYKVNLHCEDNLYPPVKELTLEQTIDFIKSFDKSYG
jgi:hypothetical protein